MAAKRDQNGRFVKGHGGGPGRPKRSTEEKYLKALSKIVTSKDWEKVIMTALSRAKAGDGNARQWLSDYLIGKPLQRTEITGADGGPIGYRNFDRDLERAYDDST